jgi:hypothetical protein
MQWIIKPLTLFGQSQNKPWLHCQQPEFSLSLSLSLYIYIYIYIYNEKAYINELVAVSKLLTLAYLNLYLFKGLLSEFKDLVTTLMTQFELTLASNNLK